MVLENNYLLISPITYLDIACLNIDREALDESSHFSFVSTGTYSF